MLRLVFSILLLANLIACSGGDRGTSPGTVDSTEGRLFQIEPGPDATTQMVLAMIDARPKDVIEFGPGYYELDSGMQLTSTENVLIRGAGRDETILSFKNSTSQEGFLASNVRGVTVEDLTILDSPGDAFKLQGVNFGTLRRVRAIWSSGRLTEDEDTITAENYREKLDVQCTDPARHNPANPNPLETDTSSPDYNVSVESGRYGIYPVNSQNILVDDTISVGASDAGIYVGQTDNAIIKNSVARFNVFGFEIENVRGGEYIDNLAECNTGGFLVYDLDGLTRYGKKTRVHRNIARNNNTYNFATPGSIVSNVPRGSGMITLGYDQIEIFDNVFENHGTAGIIHTSYVLMGEPGDRRLDMYTEGVHIYNNVFRDNGNDLPQPDVATILATGGSQVTSAFPLIVGLKIAAAGGGYRGAHIVWDGYADEYDPDCPYPVDDQGQPIPADEDGKPISGNQYPNPDCRYNAYKFDENGERIKLKWWFSCIDANNEFDGDSQTYANFHGTEGLELLLDTPGALTNPLSIVQGLAGFAADLDMGPHDCVAEYGSNLPPLPPIVIPAYTPSGNIDPAPSAAEVARLCGAGVSSGQINQAAYSVDCPSLDQYHLFSDPADPMSLPNGTGIPFVLTTKLFSDYSSKYRVIYLPDGEQAIYRDGQDGENATILFPVGTIIAKTFAFPNENTGEEIPAETRLIIKRQRRDGTVYWAALEYIWKPTASGTRVAELVPEGGTMEVSWDYHDVNNGQHYQGSSSAYQLPNQGQCRLCHANDDAETGAAPIGPKPRNLNRPYASDSPLPQGTAAHPIAGNNQIVWMCENGFMKNCPADMQLDPLTKYVTNIERNPTFNVPGDSGHVAGTGADIEARVRAYLEVNCAHCHNNRGLAQNTGFYLDVFRPVDDTYGICKGPTASGSDGRGGREFDIVPGSAADSILPYRIGPDATTLAAIMPPLARSTVHSEAVELISTWIDTVVDDSYANADACGSGGLLGLPIR